MRRHLARAFGWWDWANALILAGITCTAVAVWANWSTWVWAFVGIALMLWGVLLDVTRPRRAAPPQEGRGRGPDR
jgi:hypothetical protein